VKHLEKLIEEKKALMRGTTRASKVVEVVPDGHGGFLRKELDPAKVQARFKDEWVASVRAKLGLSQAKFATLLGISKRTVQEWEQGRSVPSGAARVLLRIAATNPKVVLEAA